MLKVAVYMKKHGLFALRGELDWRIQKSQILYSTWTRAAARRWRTKSTPSNRLVHSLPTVSDVQINSKFAGHTSTSTWNCCISSSALPSYIVIFTPALPFIFVSLRQV